ncbi:hypothetical protein PB2503_09364 [Parvularcula bermudensis HTCC2503]|uniref:VOC domain-containing protein n=1 Tax=Parvularcula bermudensis (strain ATCC BAA-594 / HTCC2503 / KCTC 12087) TaxID=314260 RepID=E0TDA3_PARBH|nr:VOC family protein [Parvularcula bermudensis]ADM09926.1 hypothetical protein PB2503_09364 [Parvularcula bermudensis HTCC2503]
MDLGAFSVSLAVKDLKTSEAFYAKLGFERTGGDEKYAIMINGTTIIGLFEGMFEGNILTFNPGLTNDQQVLDNFTDIRDLQAALEAQGVTLIETTDPDGTGIGHVTLTDPDGNAILIDQHLPKPIG